MSIKYDPTNMLRKVAPEKKVKRLVTRGLTLRRTALSFVSDIDFLSRKKITEVALKTVKGYQERVAKEIVESGFDEEAGDKLERQLAKNPKQLIQRVQNEVVFEISKSIKKNYSGEKYRWLPSDAEEPDPEHQLNYGKIFTIGDGEMPGDRYGCRCGMEILVKEEQLDLE